MTATTKAVGFCLLRLLIAALFSPAHNDARKMADTTAMAVNIPRGFRNLRGSDTAHMGAEGSFPSGFANLSLPGKKSSHGRSGVSSTVAICLQFRPLV
ncbi:hypothetical protein EYF80_030184 [Liparis tanakae]|uniref:Secreted protein n=1 Tax=Liparis tanakae TaxID=230148 RepID=A0A4Z2H3Z7_9TELE|nr:hypothetical protein EYF80_030184 [Liparis tanakae]